MFLCDVKGRVKKNLFRKQELERTRSGGVEYKGIPKLGLGNECGKLGLGNECGKSGLEREVGFGKEGNEGKG